MKNVYIQIEMPFVYFIHEDGVENCFKVGKTENHPADRLDQLQTGNPRRLRVYRWIKISDCGVTEEYLHMLFNEAHIRGEWFHITREQIDSECEMIVTNNPDATVSGRWEQYTDEDRLNVKRERKTAGKYRGKGDPTAAADRKNKYMERQQLNRVYNMIGFSDD
jgi:hypothetical protein